LKRKPWLQTNIHGEENREYRSSTTESHLSFSFDVEDEKWVQEYIVSPHHIQQSFEREQLGGGESMESQTELTNLQNLLVHIDRLVGKP
jgi:hypothetical protein